MTETSKNHATPPTPENDFMVRLRIQEFASKRHMSMRKLADKLSLDYQTVLYWNKGRSFPRLTLLIRVARILCCRIDDLIERPRPGPKPKKKQLIDNLSNPEPLQDVCKLCLKNIEATLNEDQARTKASLKPNKKPKRLSAS